MEGVSMSFGKMNTFIDLVKKEVSVDAEGFKSEKEANEYLAKLKEKNAKYRNNEN